MTTPITFPSGQSAEQCASKLVRLKTWSKARPAIRQIDGKSCHVVLLIGERIMTTAEA